MSILSYFNVDKKTELKIRRRKAKTLRLTRAKRRFIEERRFRRFEKNRSIESFLGGIVVDCVDAAFTSSEERKRYGEVKVKVEGEEKKLIEPEEKTPSWNIKTPNRNSKFAVVNIY